MTVKIQKIDNVHIQVIADPHVRMGLSEHFSRYAKNYQFSPEYKARVWNGKIYHFNYTTGVIYAGLILDVLEYLKENGIKAAVDAEVKKMFVGHADGVREYLAGLNLTTYGSPVDFHDYQIDAIEACLSQKRKTLRSPTSSGKSAIAYGVIRYLCDNVFEDHDRILVIVPTVGLVKQFKGDMVDYSQLTDFDAASLVGMVDQKHKELDRKIVVGTYQSIIRQDYEWINGFRAIIVDECHQAPAKTIKDIAVACDAEYRIGMSGSINDNEESEIMLIKGLFGFDKETTTTKDLMDRGIVADLTIKCIILDHQKAGLKPSTYQDEMNVIQKSSNRNGFIRKIAEGNEGNTLVILQNVKTHAKSLLEELKKIDGKQVFLVVGKTDVEVRDEVKKITESNDNVIILASYGVFAEGISIRNLHNIILASPTKSYRRIVQTIGRGLRITNTKKSCTIYDLVDLFFESGTNDEPNFTFRHFKERLMIYIKSDFRHKTIQVPFTP